MAMPITNSMILTGVVFGTRARSAQRSIQRHVRTSSAVPKTAGMTVEKEMLERTKYSKSEKCSPPRYCQLPRRLFIHSKSHQAGAERKKSPMKFLRDRIQSELPVRCSPSV